MSRKVELKFTHWVFVDDVKFFGPGRLQLLHLIQETGSIAKAAKAMGMSYKKAWRMVDEMNTIGREPFVLARKGGQQGGGTELTPHALKVMKAYQALQLQLQSVVDAANTLRDLV